MATKSRTYLPTDWQVWTYTPVASKFRLDFSTLDGSDVLGGSSDTGSIQVLDLNINSIQINDGTGPYQGVFFSYEPPTMVLSAQLNTWDSDLVKELYNGKAIYLTLKNEATNNEPTFGKNTVFFYGFIDDLQIDVDPRNSITNLTISALDVSSSMLNVPISITRLLASTKVIQISQALDDAQTAGLINSNIDFVLGSSPQNDFETTGTIVKTAGEWIEEYVVSDVCRMSTYMAQKLSGGVVSYARTLRGFTISTNAGGGPTIPDSVITNVIVTQDGANSPTAFNLSNLTSQYSYGIEAAGIASNPTVYSQTIEVPLAGLEAIANKIKEFSQAIRPTEVTVKTATTYQTINFTNAVPPFGSNAEYFYPENMYFNSQQVSTDIAFLGSVSYNHMVVGTSHTITPDDWQTTYQLWKGL